MLPLHIGGKVMKDLFIDLECFSDINLPKCGAYKYAQSMHFEILLFGYSVDNIFCYHSISKERM